MLLHAKLLQRISSSWTLGPSSASITVFLRFLRLAWGSRRRRWRMDFDVVGGELAAPTSTRNPSSQLSKKKKKIPAASPRAPVNRGERS